MTYVLLSAFWTVAGLAVGYWLGRAGRQLPPHPNTEPVVVPSSTPPAEAAAEPRRRDQIFGALLIALALASVIGTAVFISNQQQVIDRQTAQVACQNAYNEANADALAQRNEAAAKERAGQRRLLEASFAPNRDPAAIVQAYRDYLALLAEADAQRNANPLPARTC